MTTHCKHNRWVSVVRHKRSDRGYVPLSRADTCKDCGRTIWLGQRMSLRELLAFDGTTDVIRDDR